MSRYRQTAWSGSTCRRRVHQNPWCPLEQQLHFHGPSNFGGSVLMAQQPPRNQNLSQMAICMMLPPRPRTSLLQERTLAINMCPPVPQPYFTNGSFSVGYQIPPTVEPGDLYGGMEQTWKACFETFFQNLPHVWMFGVCESEYSGWFVFRDMAKVRFLCQHCGRRWSSMNSSAVFYYSWDAEAQCGHIRFSLKGQKCRQCRPSHFETPMWYPEEVQKVMANLYYEVASCIYGLITPPMIKNKRHGRPRAHHDSSMCQGCNQSFCQVAKI
ncbi:uncharacterized protein [Palaemon carinicauda]|uniref:uncharacterized protein n=1 Tax=Palaemon carinicauda TaxID=392227 RepID=UPI0035B58AAF